MRRLELQRARQPYLRACGLYDRTATRGTGSAIVSNEEMFDDRERSAIAFAVEFCVFMDRHISGKTKALGL